MTDIQPSTCDLHTITTSTTSTTSTSTSTATTAAKATAQQTRTTVTGAAVARQRVVKTNRDAKCRYLFCVQTIFRSLSLSRVFFSVLSVSFFCGEKNK